MVRTILRLTAVVLLVAGCVLLSLRALTPLMNKELAGIQNWLADELGWPVDIKNMRLAWQGGHFVVRFSPVEVLSPNSTSLLSIHRVDVRLRPLASLLARRWVIAELALSGIQTSVHYHANGDFSLPSFSEGDGKISGVDWQAFIADFPIDTLIIDHADIQVIRDEGNPLVLTEVQALLERTHAVLKVRVAGDFVSGIHTTSWKMASDIQFMAMSQPIEWYINVQDIAAEKLKNYLPDIYSPPFLGGSITIQGWMTSEALALRKGVWVASVNNIAIAMDNPDAPLFFEHLQGQIQWDKMGEDEWKLTGDRFFINHQKYPLRWEINQKKSSEGQLQYQWRASHLPLENWILFLKEQSFIPQNIRQWMMDYRPQGLIRTISASHGENLEQGISFSMDATEMGFQNHGFIPGTVGWDVLAVFDGKTGFFKLKADEPVVQFQGISGPVDLTLKESVFYAKGLFESPMDWRVETKGTSLWSKAPLAFGGVLEQHRGPVSLNAVATGRDLSANWISHHFPAGIIDDEVATVWLSEAIPSGNIQEVSFVFRGNLVDFPFRKQEGLFEVSAFIENAYLNYDEGWPAVEGLNAWLDFHNEGLVVDAVEAMVAGEKVQSLWASIPDLETPFLTVEAETDHTLEKGVDILLQSTLANEVKPVFESVILQGPMHLSLNLFIPLANDDPVQVQGKVSPRQASIQIPDVDITLSDVLGSANFTEQKIEANLSANTLNVPVQIQLQGAWEGTQTGFDIRAQTNAPVEWDIIKEWCALSYADDIKGKANWDLYLNIPVLLHQTPIKGSLQSALEGTTLSFPMIIQKTDHERKLLHVDFEQKTEGWAVDALWEQKTHIKGHWSEHSSFWDIHSPEVEGEITLKNGSPKQVEAKVKKLVLPTVWSQDLDFSTWQKVSWPHIHATIEHLQWKKADLKQLDISLTPSQQGLDIALNAENELEKWRLEGDWRFLKAQSLIQMKGSWVSKDIAYSLRNLGIETNLKDADSVVDFDLRWKGSPWSIQFPTLEGEGTIAMKKGRILGVNPGLGRVFSLFNIENVERRLRLDFSDLYKSGFSFDNLSASAKIEKGKASTQDLVIKGPVAQIEAEGTVDLSNEVLEGHLVVLPKVSGTLPMAAAIAAGNPAVGAAVWVVNHIVSSQKGAKRYEYKLQGTLSNPLMTDLETQQNIPF